MIEIEVKTKRQHAYNIYIGQAVLQEEKLLKDIFSSKQKLLILTDKKVADLYLDSVMTQLRQYTNTVKSFILPQGEEAKTLKVVEEVVAFLDENSYERQDAILALGGGTVGDSAGFCASIYKRGMTLVHVPTTLLAQVDSSIGGKTAVNMGQGKNRIGTFYQPDAVLMDPLFLLSLDKTHYAQGFAEIIKYAASMDKELFTYLKQTPLVQIEKNMAWIIERCARHKAKIVSADECDFGGRRVLNFGHSLAHAIELIWGYEAYSHGQAVAIGMYVTTKISEEKKLSKTGSAAEIKALLQKFDLPWQMPSTEAEKIVHILKNDKKTQGNVLREVIISEIGQAHIIQVPFAALDELTALYCRG